MMSCFHIMDQIQIQAVGELFAATQQGDIEAKSAVLELPCIILNLCFLFIFTFCCVTLIISAQQTVYLLT